MYLASDAHLGAAPSENEDAFLRWLEHAGGEASRIVLNGDLFDFWFEYGSVIPRGHTRVLGLLARIVDSGVPVLLMGGNHDWWGGSFLTDEIGVEFHQDAVRLVLAGRTTFLAHGDGLGRGDWSYRILRWVLRSRPTRWAFRWLHPDVGAWLARRVSQTERRGSGSTAAERERAEALRSWAADRLRQDEELDLVVLGHTHLPFLEEVEPGRYYLNAGDWVHHRSYAVLEAGSAPRLVRWTH